MRSPSLLSYFMVYLIWIVKYSLNETIKRQKKKKKKKLTNEGKNEGHLLPATT